MLLFYYYQLFIYFFVKLSHGIRSDNGIPIKSLDLGGKQSALWEYESSEWAAIMKVAWVLIDKSGCNADIRELDIVRLRNDSLIKLVLVSHRFAGKFTS